MNSGPKEEHTGNMFFENLLIAEFLIDCFRRIGKSRRDGLNLLLYRQNDCIHLAAGEMPFLSAHRIAA
jgi:hypothetical protein